ncbi:hypothetical protein BJV78DRAFT_211634 [Lactifluus subvellereus]|nr:hypothetical protein BJV78DRAFT_211634 [Lactifluus subvellereus]
MSRASIPLHTIDEVLGKRNSWPGVSYSLSERQNSESYSRPTSLTTSLSYAYTVRSINARVASRFCIRARFGHDGRPAWMSLPNRPLKSGYALKSVCIYVRVASENSETRRG